MWMGGWVDPVLKRIARMADGWIVSGRPEPNIIESAVRLKDYVQAEGRDPASVGLQGGVLVRTGRPEHWREDFETWRSLGATHVHVNTMAPTSRPSTSTSKPSARPKRSSANLSCGVRWLATAPLAR